MKENLFSGLPDDARIWINAADRDLTIAEQRDVLVTLSTFIDGWSSHGHKVVAEAALVKDRFAVIAAHIPGGDVSGCGIDASVHALAELAGSLGFGWASALSIFFDAGGRVRQTDRATFSSLAEAGSVSLDTVVFDLSLATLGAWRQGQFEVPARQSWHGRVFRFAVEAD